MLNPHDQKVNKKAHLMNRLICFPQAKNHQSFQWFWSTWDKYYDKHYVRDGVNYTAYNQTLVTPQVVIYFPLICI